MLWSPTEWKFTLRAPDGSVVQETDWVKNVLTREGSYLMLDVFFRNTAISTPVRFQLGLANSQPTIHTTATTLSGEVSGGGYARINLARHIGEWPTLATDINVIDSPYRIESLPKTFQAVGEQIGPFTTIFLVALVQETEDPQLLTPKLICAASTQTVQNIPPGNSLDATMRLSLTT